MRPVASRSQTQHVVPGQRSPYGDYEKVTAKTSAGSLTLGLSHPKIRLCGLIMREMGSETFIPKTLDSRELKKPSSLVLASLTGLFFEKMSHECEAALVTHSCVIAALRRRPPSSAGML